MSNQNTHNPTNLASFLGSIILVFDGFSMLAYGLLIFVISGIADPVDFSIETKKAGLRLGAFFALITLVYLVVCLISLKNWKEGKRVWRYIILGLGLLHLVWFGLYFISGKEFEFLTYLFYGSLVANILLCILVIFGQTKASGHQSGET
jgi:hypothetical protein